MGLTDEVVDEMQVLLERHGYSAASNVKGVLVTVLGVAVQKGRDVRVISGVALRMGRTPSPQAA